MAWGLLSKWFGGDDEEDDIETQAIDYYRKNNTLMMNQAGDSWALDYIPRSLPRTDQAQWMMLSDGKLPLQGR
jgi:hypothetical protein|tara:strand:- start:591 stop:809 length:219 start_codon:yes stop_codon:yes gene_type:complete